MRCIRTALLMHEVRCALCAFCRVIASLVFLCLSVNVLADAPLVTGQVEDGDSQVVEMPRLPGSYLRTIEWMVAEGSWVEPGDVIVRLDPGDLIEREESQEIAVEEHRLQAESQIANNALAVLDAEVNLLKAQSTVRLARLDAEIPAEARASLIHEQAQLNLVNAENALERARKQLVNLRTEREELIPVTEMSTVTAEEEWARYREAIQRTEVRANRSGLVIYGENPVTGEKIFPGLTLPASIPLLMVASREDLLFRLWVHEADVLNFTVGMPLVITPDSLPDVQVEAYVDWISSQALERSAWSAGGYFEVVAKPTEALPVSFIPGMSIMARRSNVVN